MANKVFNMAGGRHSAAAYSAFEDALYGSCVATDSDFVATAGTGMTVQLTSGNGLISTGSGYARRIQADSTNPITITAASATLPRTDSIVAYIDNAVTPTTSVTDNTNNILRFVAVAGTPASTPSAPSAVTIQSAVGAGNPYMVLWDVTIPAGATAMNTAVFTDKRKTAKVEIADGSITTAKLADEAVTAEKIGDGEVTSEKIDWTTSEDFTSKVSFTDQYANAIFMRFGRIVWFFFQGSNKSHTAGETSFTVPAGYRPKKGSGSDDQVWFSGNYASGNTSATATTFYIRPSSGVGGPNTSNTSTTRLYVSGMYFIA